ncbi:MarR family transcriptional regulator [Adhaeribacter swui]|uniref:MarR family transcriptional regulator n=1 Tax=Adhaeribacter swui TaxID=2086471 RepID=A0A7G7GBY6_9BACT|nr:MarR family transcriptional regulator [Adhaeribacter swui]QNF34670.1 MarR family transcriptional regulator [Adhaeribacter swui]
MNNNYALIIAQTAFHSGKAIEHEFDSSGIDLNFREYVFLNFLFTGQELIQQDLAEILKKDKSAVLRSIDVLVKKNLVTRIPHSQDRRKKKLQLTHTGTNLFKKAQTIAEKVFAQLQQGLTPEEIATFTKVALHMQRSPKSENFLTK